MANIITRRSILAAGAGAAALGASEQASAQSRVQTASNVSAPRLAIEIGDTEDVREWATGMLLIARAIERMGDNAVDIGEQTAFVVTGLFREFEDASHPEQPVRS